MMKKIKPSWCSWPDTDFKRDTEDLYKTGARCDAWRSFLQSGTVKTLLKIKGRVIWFNRYEYFDRLICEFDCSEKRLIAVIKSLMRSEHGSPLEFVRNDIYDARAWTYLPLSCFAEIEGCGERSGKQHCGNGILKHNEMPFVQFGIKKPWVVKRSCFTLTHRLRHNERFAVMTFNHRQLDFRFKGKRWVGEKTFPSNATRSEMTDHLFKIVENECEKHMVTIID